MGVHATALALTHASNPWRGDRKEWRGARVGEGEGEGEGSGSEVLVGGEGSDGSGSGVLINEKDLR